MSAARRARKVADTESGIDVSRRAAPGTVLAGRYRIVTALGVGGMGVVYRAHDLELDQDVAVKVMRPDLGDDPAWVDRMRSELRLAREVSHRHVVRIHDIHEADGLRFLTMSFVDGPSLLTVMEKEGVLPAPRAVRIARQVAEALQQAHDAGIVHRDLKPANILLDGEDNAYVTDFGVARAMGASGPTRTGVVVGTPDYLSPEQVAGEPVDGRTDVYALGLVLFEMLTGELPFRPGSQSEMLAQRLAGRVRETRETGVAVPLPLQRVLRRCLERRPSRRWARAIDLARALENPPRARPSPRLVAALLLTVAAALGVAAWRARPQPPPAPAVEAVAVPVRHAVAVLPLTDETGSASLQWTSTGLAEMLGTRLAADPSLRVVDAARVARAAADLQLSPGTADERFLRQVADLLGADVLVVGAVRRAGLTLGLEMRALAARGSGLARLGTVAERADSEAGLFAMVDTAAGRLRTVLGTDDRAVALPTDETTAVPAALASYEEGRRLLAAGDPAGALPPLQAAVAADGAYAAALVAVSEAEAARGESDRALAAAQLAAALVGQSRTRLAERARARLASLQGDPARAARILAELARRVPNDPQPLIEQAAAQVAEGDVAGSITTLQKAAALDRADPRVWYQLGRSSILAGDSQRAVADYLLQALALQNQLKNRQGQADVLNALGAAHQQLGQGKEAEARFSEAILLREALGDERGLAASLLNRARARVDAGDGDAAEKDLLRAQALATKLQDKATLADVANDLGVLAESRGAFTDALARYQDALRLRRDLGDTRRLAGSYDNVGYVYFLLGEYDHSQVYWDQAKALHSQGGEANGVVLSTQNLGFLQLARGAWDEATTSFATALEGARKSGFRQAEPVSVGNIGLVHQAQGRYPAALQSYDEAIALLTQLEDPSGLTEFTLARASALLELGRLDEAKAQIDATTPWLEQTQNQEQAADRAALLGEWHLRKGDAAAARTAFADAVRQAAASHSRPALLRVRVAQAAASAGQGGDLAAARTTLREAESLGHALLRLRAGEAVARDALAQGLSADAEAAARTALGLAGRCGWHAGAFRLHDVLARALAARGDKAGAALERAQAVKALEEVRAPLDAAARATFDSLPAVRSAAGSGMSS